MTHGQSAERRSPSNSRSTRRRPARHRKLRSYRLWAIAVVVPLGAIAAACSGGSTLPAASSQPTTTVASGGGSASTGTSPLAEAVTYSQCIRSHGVPNFPDPVQTPDGGYGYRTSGIDPNSAAFQNALQACKSLPSPWNSTGKDLSSAQQQAWLNWASCIRNHGVPNFPDPTFSGSEVRDSGTASNSPSFQSAMDSCKSKMPSVGGLGG